MKIVVVDDQEDIRYSVAKILKEENHIVYELSGIEKNLIEEIAKIDPFLILLDVKLGTISGIDILYSLKKNKIENPVVLMTAFTTPTNIIEATKMGVRNILQKPFCAQTLLEIVSKYTIKESIKSEMVLSYDSEQFIGTFDSMGEIYKKIGVVATNNLSVMIRGETGSGKELVARLIHAHSNRKEHPLITINCAAIPKELFESEFFGHEKGSFTGANKQHIGYFESGNRGSVFLDEVGEMPLDMQSKLLRFLETKNIKRVGGTKEISLDVKIISATNIDISNSIQNGYFREDLYYRLSSLYIEMPPLRNRRDDIPLLVNHFIDRANRELHTNIKSISKDALDILCKHIWQGNVRELKNVITNAALQAIGESITVKDIKLLSSKAKNEHSLYSSIEQELIDIGYENAYKVYESVQNLVVKATLKKYDHNITKAANALRVSRNTLKSKKEIL